MKTLRLIDRTRLKVQLQWEYRDWWVGLFWRRSDIALHLYICIIPMIPLHVTVFWPKEKPAYVALACAPDEEE